MLDLVLRVLDAAVTVVSLVLGTTFITFDLAGRFTSNRRSASAVALIVGSGAIVLAVFDRRFLGLAVLIYLLILGLHAIVRRAAAYRRAPERAAAVEEAAVDRSGWPLSGPGARLGRVGMIAVWFTTHLLCVLNPYQVLEASWQMAGNAHLQRRERRTGNDRRTYRTQAVYTLPFAGKWLLVNGGHTPKTSHSWNVLGQRFALDFVQANDAVERHTGRGTRAEEYFCFGRDILAAADGTVVRAESRVRQAFLGWGVCDFTARSFVGNHVLIEHAEGEFALYAHLIRGSVTVAPGDRVQRGQPLGRCGHTGHSTEPHLHFHLQDSADLFYGMGLPIRFSHLLVDGHPATDALLTSGNRVQSTPDARLV